MKTALVIGGSRLIGPRLVETLLDRGYRVIVFNRGTRPARFEGMDVQQVVGNRNAEDDLARVAQLAPDIVFDTCCYEPHQAGMVVDLFGNRLQRYVYVSTVAVYREPQEFPIVEESPLGLWPLWGEYGLNKARTDQTFLEAYQTIAFPVTILRPTYILGSGNHVEREAFFTGRLLRQVPIVIPGDGQALISFAFADEVAQAMVRLAETPKAAGQVYNCARDQAVTLLGFVHLCARLLGVEVQVLFADPAEFQFSMTPYHPPDLSPFANAHVLVSNRKLEQTIRIGLAPLKTKLREVLDWYATHLERYPVKLRPKEIQVLSSFGYTTSSHFGVLS